MFVAIRCTEGEGVSVTETPSPPDRDLAPRQKPFPGRWTGQPLFDLFGRMEEVGATGGREVYH